MRPLREHTDSMDPNLLAAQALLAKVGPLEPSADRQRRVRLRLDSSSRQPLPPLLRPALIAAVLLAVTGAGAKIGGVLPASPMKAVEELFSKPVQSLAEPVAQAKASTQALRAKAVEARADEAPQAEPPAAGASHARKARPAAPGASSESAKLVVEAMKARRSGDSARASKLLKEYQRKYPEGALQEEALALRMEAAAGRGDASAAKLARQYLSRYPNGRFRDQAQRVLASAKH